MDSSQPGHDAIAASAQIQSLLRCARQGSLATLDRETGHPYVSVVLVATAPDGAPVMLLSSLARHTQNLVEDARASILLTEGGGGDPLVRSRVTVIGRIAPDPSSVSGARFLLRQPGAAAYAGFGDFRLFRLEPESAHLVAGFGRIDTFSADAFMLHPDAGAAVWGEMDAVEHMNADHREALALYAEAFLGEARGGEWRMEGFDATGMEISSESRVRYLPFPEPLKGSSDLRRVLVAMAADARANTAARAEA